MISEIKKVEGEPRLQMSFMAELPEFSEATQEYINIWESEGSRIAEALERVSGLKFSVIKIDIVVYEGISYSGWDDKPMRLRASYPLDVKKSTLIHELGHRLIPQAETRPDGIDEEKVLFLILYDVWLDLYGEDFANRMVQVESHRRGLYDYETSWKWALSLGKDGRKRMFEELVTNP